MKNCFSSRLWNESGRSWTRKACSHSDIVSRARKEWPFLKSVGCVRQTRILMIQDSDEADITPDEETFRKKGTFRQPKPEAGDREGAATQTAGLISDMEMKLIFQAETHSRCSYMVML